MKELSKKGKVFEFLIALIFILIGVFLRLLPHPPNFAPVAAIALFSGVYLSRKISLTLPIIVMVISDVFLGFYEIRLMAVVYASFLICVLLGIWLKRHKGWQQILASSLFSALVFFLLTNFAVWAFTPWYPKTLFGLIQCYLMALPFFRNTILGNLFYTSIFFGAFELAQKMVEVQIKRYEQKKYIIN